MISVWTDGSCRENPGPGGWAFIVAIDGDVLDTFKGGADATTNNKMEMTAVIRAIEFLRRTYPGDPATIYCDSEYVVKGITEWMTKWKSRGWVKKGGAIKNLDLWKRLDQIVSPNLTFTWVKGHQGEEMNELADHLAGQGAKPFERREDYDPAEAFPFP